MILNLIATSSIGNEINCMTVSHKKILPLRHFISKLINDEYVYDRFKKKKKDYCLLKEVLRAILTSELKQYAIIILLSRKMS